MKFFLTNLLFGAALFLTGCEDVAEYKGQYLGVLFSGSDKDQQNIVLFVKQKTVDDQQQMDVTINELRGSATPEVLKFSINDKNQIKLIWKDQTRSFKIEKTLPCYLGKSAEEKIRICLNKNIVEISLEQIDESQNILSLNVKKTDDLGTYNTNTFNASTTYSTDDLVGRAKFMNYTVRQKAQEVYRAKMGVAVALGNLSTHLNLKDVLGFIVEGPLSFVESIGNFMPFLFPSNWFKFKESKELHRAEIKSYAALRGNEMNAVETLSYLHLRNIQVAQFIGQELEWLKQIQKNLETKELVGDLPQGTSLLFSMKVGTLSLDKGQIDTFLSTENTFLAQAVAFPIVKPLMLAPLNPIDLTHAEALSPDSCFQTVLTESLEISAIDFMIKASKHQTEVRRYLYLDPSSDGVLSSGTPSSIRIGESYENELKIKRKEIASFMQKKCADTMSERNNAVQTYKTSALYLKNALALKKLLAQKVILEGSASTEVLLEIVSNSEDVIKLKSNIVSSQIQFLASESKLNRLTLTGYYKNLEVGL
ncbi:MAG: hypothetical protein AABY64_00160 [Bdellovibrionota bacterium]|mgnify:CR=1 FL=1